MSFFKNDNGVLLEAPNFVYGPGFTLTKDDTTKEGGGWKWFDTVAEAETFFGVKAKADQQYTLTRSQLEQLGITETQVTDLGISKL